MNLQTVARNLPLLSRVLSESEEEEKRRLLRSVPHLPPSLTRPPMNVPAIEPLAPIQEPSPSLAELGAPPILIRRNSKQRPLEAIGGDDSLERDEALLEAQQGYKAPRSTKDLLLRLGMGFLGGGLPGAAAQGLGYELNQDVRNQDAVGSDMAQAQGRIRTETLQRNRTNDWLNDQSQRDYRDAQAEKVLRPEGFSLSPGQHRFENGKDIASLPPLERTPREHNPLIVELKNPDGSTRRKQSDDYGKTWHDVEGLGDAPPIDKPDGSEFTNAQLEQNIREATTERDRIWSSLKDVPPTITKPPIYAGEQPTVEPNPAYTDLMRRGRELDDHIRTYRGQLKAPKVLTRGSGISEQTIRDAAKAKGLDPDVAVERARKRKML